MMNAVSFMFGDVEAERTGLHRVLSTGLQNETHRRTRECEQDGAADRHEPKRDQIIDGVTDGDDIGHRQPDLPAREAGVDHDEVLQHQHRDESRQPKIRAAHAQCRQCQHDAAGHRRNCSGDEAHPDRRLVEIVENARGVGAGADQEGRAEIDLAGKAEQEVPGHGKDAEIIRERQQAENVAGGPERQEGGQHYRGQADQKNAARRQ